MFTLTTNFEFFIFSYFKGLEELYQDFQNKTKINQAIKDYLGTRVWKTETVISVHFEEY